MPFPLNLKLGRGSGADVVGLDIQPGLVAAVQARVNGSVLAQNAAVLPLAADTLREGEVVDEGTLSEALRELFAGSRLSKRVRVGVANQRTVMRTLELPPVTDSKELAAAVHFQAQDQVPMPLDSAVLDFHPLGIVDTPAGPRQRVVLVAAQRDMIERLLAAVRAAGLHPVGIDLSAFALIRSLYRADAEHAGRVLYLNVDGLTNLAIAEGAVCRFTRVVGGGLETMAGELAQRRGIALTDARALLASVDLTLPVPGGAIAPAAPAVETDLASELDVLPEPELVRDPEPAFEPEVAFERDPALDPDAFADTATDAELAEDADHEAREAAMSYAEMSSVPTAAVGSDADVREVLEDGIHAISGEVRNSLEFHRSQDDGGEVSRIVLSGSALDVHGFAEALQTVLGLEVHSEGVGVADQSLSDEVATNRLAVATGLAATEVHQ
jgi:type IV pilus assembly protein PilM